MIEVVKPGFFTLIQDAGRFGYQEFGMPISGALDLDSFRLANWLVGNSLKEAVLEVTLTGPVLKFYTDMSIGITGADMQPKLDNAPIEMYKTIPIRKGSVLSFGKLQSGCRAYVSFAGGFSLEKEMGSASTYTYAKLGGVKGRALRKGDTLPFLRNQGIGLKTVPEEFHIQPYRLLSVRIIEGPEASLFLNLELDKFYTNEYVVSSKSNRMGVRLEGVFIKSAPSSEMLSSGVVKGTIQVPSNGQPILLLADAQTTGGYPRIGNVIQADLSLIAQQKPGDRIRFRKISLEEAHSLAYDKEMALKKILEN
tara:strand:- start:5255 stop:6181 length:927 start_codon:yes stop_codon:yes gene_type:complete